MADVLCPTCGKPNSEHREFCDFCSNPLDGALRVEGESVAPGDDFLGSQPTESMDDASRLDSLVPAPEEDLQPYRLEDLQTDDFLNGDSRLESLFADDPEGPTQIDPQDTEPLNGGSRLDDYLPVEGPTADLKSEIVEEDDFSRLNDYLSSEEPSEETLLSTASLYTEPEDDFSRLDDYLTPETQPKDGDADDISRLNDFFADDPFKSPDPFLEPSASEEKSGEPYSPEQDPFAEPPTPTSEFTLADDDPDIDPLFTRDELLSDSSPLHTLDTPVEDQPAESLDAGEWDFLAPTPEPEKPVEDQPAESLDAGEWDFLAPTPEPEKPVEDQPAESLDAGEWDFLVPTPEPEKPVEDQPAESLDVGEWDFLDPSPTPEQPEGDSPADSIDVGEWDFMESSPSPGEPTEAGPAETMDAGDLDFLDPGYGQEDLERTPELSQPDATEDLSFLDPGPTADLADGESDQEIMPEGDGEDAGWLDMLQDPGSRQKAVSEPESTSEPDKPQTDWLDKIKRLNKSSDLVDEDSSFPDWLSVTGKTAEFAGEDQESSDDVPDWLQLDDDDSLNEFLRKKDLTNEEYRPKVTTDSLDDTVITGGKERPDPGLSDSQQIKFPSWAEEKKKEQKRQQDKSAAISEEEIEPFQIEEEIFDDLFSEELPSWLTASSSGEVKQVIGENLAHGELPGWVEAMRPVVESSDTSGLDDDEEYIENYGPLAGIPSVLPAEAEIGIDMDQAIQKPLDLLATKSQQEYVDLIKKLVGDENKSKSIRLPSPPKTQRALRWVISIIMLVGILGTVIFSGSIEAEPLTAAQVQGTGFGALYDEIEILFDGQPVLIAFDYQPASAGELHTAAATVVDHLLEQGTYLTFISTQPTGPALAEHFLDTTQSRHNYLHTQKYINLGYLPGESAGLLSFLIAPEKIIPLAFDGSNAWDSPPLISIDGIEDFKMILVITDDPNTAKIWIEQVGTRLDDTPLTMVVSAQVEPLIQPYFRTSPRQVSGYVAGIIDSMNYEVLTERPYLAHLNWLPFNIGIVISVAIIFIGGLANGVLSLFSRRKDKDKFGGESK